MEELVLAETTDRVRRITLNRPGARNALDRALQLASADALHDAEHDDGVDVVILTGTDPAFCAGLDLRDFAGSLAGVGRDAAARGDRPPNPVAALHRMTKPVIGAVNGAAITGGFELALNCDFLVASEHARFADTHARVGVVPGWGMSVLLPMAVGLRRAKEMTFTGDFLGAEEAHRLGLVNHVVAHADLLPFTHDLAVTITGTDQPTTRTLKRLYDANARLTVGDALAHERTESKAWRVDPAEVERRRAAIVDRGRAQQG